MKGNTGSATWTAGSIIQNTFALVVAGTTDSNQRVTVTATVQDTVTLARVTIQFDVIVTLLSPVLPYYTAIFDPFTGSPPYDDADPQFFVLNNTTNYTRFNTDLRGLDSFEIPLTVPDPDGFFIGLIAIADAVMVNENISFDGGTIIPSKFTGTFDSSLPLPLTAGYSVYEFPLFLPTTVVLIGQIGSSKPGSGLMDPTPGSSSPPPSTPASEDVNTQYSTIT